MSTIRWYPSPELLAQEGHTLLGIACVSLPMALWGSIMAMIVGTVIGISYMLIKEFTFDLWIENDSIEEGWKDIFWFTLGAGCSWASIFLIR